MHDEMRCWIYSGLAAIFADLEAPAAPPEGVRAGIYPQTREAFAALRRVLDATPADDVAADHVRLFVSAIGGVPAPPYAGWYLDRALGGAASLRAAEAYASQCLEVAADAGQPADYIGTELEFLNLLCRHQLAARATGDAPALAAAREAEAGFLAGHFCRWVPQFAKAMREAAPGPVFGLVADVLEALCAEEAQRLSGALPTQWAGPAASAMDRSAHPSRSNAGGR